MKGISDKTFSVQEVADILGVSEITVRRRIQDGQLTAVINSRKNGYRITEESLMNYAKSHKTNFDSTIKKGLASVLFPTFNFLPLIALAALAGFSPEKNENFLSDPVVIDKIVQRLKVELEDFDSQIQTLQQKISKTKSDKQKTIDSEKIERLKNEKIKIKKELADLEIRKTILERKPETKTQSTE